VLLGLGVLGLFSFVFGMMAAVSQDLPAIYNFAQYKAARNSVVVDADGEELGTLTSDQNKVLLTSGQISPNIKNAVVSIEDSRFYEHSGVDFRGIGRALIHDILTFSRISEEPAVFVPTDIGTVVHFLKQPHNQFLIHWIVFSD